MLSFNLQNVLWIWQAIINNMRVENDIFHLKLLCWTRVIDRAEADSNVQLKTIHRFVCNNPQIVFFPTIQAIFFWPILSSDVVHSRRFVSPPEKKIIFSKSDQIRCGISQSQQFRKPTMHIFKNFTVFSPQSWMMYLYIQPVSPIVKP